MANSIPIVIIVIAVVLVILALLVWRRQRGEARKNKQYTEESILRTIYNRDCYSINGCYI